MRLLNVRSLEIRSFDRGDRPQYAIASHRWRDGAETTLRDVQEKRETNSYGYRKVERFAAFVRNHMPEVEWLWVDTCCIDKSNSQELQEAITAMYAWYEGAAVCLAYLEDINIRQRQKLQRSAWFTRGWTLQELLAPRLVVFLATEWEVIGHKAQHGSGDRMRSLHVGPRINQQIASITSVSEAVIARPELRKALSVEEKLGWMAARTTTRPEDTAYSLLGIFEVSMPLIYNEGQAAAHRRLIRAIKDAKEEESSSGILNNTNYGGGPQNISTGNVHRSGTGDIHNYGGVGAIYQYPEQREAPSSPTSTVPFLRDLDFVNRAELSTLTRKLSTGGTRVALVGLGGVGKSQLAIEYCYRARERSPDTWVLWVHASSAARFEESIRKLADDVKIPERKATKADIYQLVYDWLRDERRRRWVLVLDNADEAEFLFQCPNTGTSRARLDYLPLCAHGSILITSRNRATAGKMVDECSVVTVQPMDGDHALALLEKKLGRQDDTTEMRKLAVALEYMPLAIAQAAAYIKQRAPRCTVEQYLDKFEKSDKSRTSLLDTNSAELRRDREASNSVMLTWQISFEHIRTFRRSAADLLSLMSFFDHQSIPESVLRVREADGLASMQKGSRLSDDDDDNDDGDSRESSDDNNEDFEIDVLVLRDYHFVSVALETNAFAMHRLVQLAAWKWLKSQKQHQRWADQSIQNLDMIFPTGEYKNWGICQTLYPHARMALSLKPGERSASLQRASVLYKAAWFAQKQGLALEAEAFASSSRDVRGKNLGDNDKDTLSSETLLASILKDQGRYEAAEAMQRRVLERLEKALGPEHPETLSSVNNLALVLQSRGKYEAAEEMHRRALEGMVKALGAGHPDTLANVNNLGLVLQSQGKHEAAEKMHRQALEGWERVLGAEHPNTLISVNNLAEMLQSQGKYEAAEEMYRRALEGMEKALGAGHPDTLANVNNLGLVLQSQGKHEAAEEMYRRMLEEMEKVLKGMEKVLGAEHTSTLGSVNNLAAVLQFQGKYEVAEEMYRRVLEGMEKVLGAEHPSTLTSINNLAAVLRDQGKHEAAEEMHRRALEGREKALGAEHPNTLASVNNLALVLQSQGKYEAAEAMHRRVLEGCEKVLSAEHPDTLSSVNNLAAVLQAQGKYEVAEEMHRRVLEGKGKALGAEHPSTLNSVNNLAEVLQSRDKHEAAEEMHRRALEGREKALGAEHPDTLMSIWGFASLYRKQKRYDAAIKLHEQASAGFTKALGLSHPTTIQCTNDLSLLRLEDST